MLIVIGTFFWRRCSPQEGLKECAAGVVNEIEESFSSAADWVFPFTAMHPRVDLVVKCIYWPLVATNALFVKCAADSRQSPILQYFFHSKEVCGAAAGAFIGGAVGAAVGIVIGIVIGAIIAAGCASVILCLLAILIAAIIAAVAALAGAFAGGMIGKALAEPGGPAGTMPSGEKVAIQVGHYATMNGNFVQHGDFDGAIVAWWTHGTTLHGGPSAGGEGSGGGAPYTHVDPDANLASDACPRRDVPRPTGEPTPPPEEPPVPK